MTDEHSEEPVDETTVKAEGGIAVTGTSVEELENRVTSKLSDTFSKSFRNIYGIMIVLFVLFGGLTIFVSNLNDTVDDVKITVEHSDLVLTGATGPEAQEKNKQQIKDLVDRMDCATQRNLQKLVTILVANGSIRPESVQPLIEARCK